MSGAEVIRGPLNDVHPPTTTYTDRHTVTLGGKTVVMIHTGVAHGPDWERYDTQRHLHIAQVFAVLKGSL